MKDTKTTRRFFFRSLLSLLGASWIFQKSSTKVKAAVSIYQYDPSSCQAGFGDYVLNVCADGIEESNTPVITWDGDVIGSCCGSTTCLVGYISTGMVLEPGIHQIRVEHLYSSTVSSPVTFTVFP
jgi:hypothetical protein